jgi:riboflavin kinase
MDADTFAAKQKSVSIQNSKQADGKSDFLEHQKNVFDDFAEWFSSDEAVPKDVEMILKDIAHRVIQSQSKSTEEKKRIHILDVACGTGVLHSYLLDAASVSSTSDNNKQSHCVSIVGVDLSPKMIDKARERAQKLLRDDFHNNIQLVVSDIMEYTLDRASPRFDAVILNACFGNFIEPAKVLQHIADNLLKVGGTVAITHPLGSSFVAKLHQESPETVPHLLPASRDEFQDMTLGMPYTVAEFADGSNPESNASSPSSSSLYFAAAQRVRYRALPRVIRLRGVVDNGYGRGGKKLGFPTANLPASLFQNALQDMSTGVYFGWAVIENVADEARKKGRNVPHKAVVNIGYSPTFTGKENKEKIVEAHLMLDENSMDPPDFYGETMRLQLHGYMRPEIKFPSFPDLIAQITADVKDSKIALDQEPYKLLKADPFLVNLKNNWVGSNGGDGLASWEYTDFRGALSQS